MKIDKKKGAVPFLSRILIIEVNWRGDILFTTPAIGAIRQHNPSAFIACLVVPRCIDMLKGNPDVNELIVYDERGRHKGLINKILFIIELRKKEFDTVISFHRSMSRMLICALAGIPRRIGYYTRKRFWLLTDAVKEPVDVPHRVEYFLDIVRYLGIGAEDKNYRFFISQESITSANELLNKNGINNADEFFVINPGGNWEQKRWPKQMYAQLCARLNNKYKKAVVITGAEKDILLAEEIIKASGIKAINLCGKTTIKDLAAVMKRASLIIANDSGPMHIAVSQKTPTIAIFGPTSPKITGPYGNAPYIALHKWFDCEIPCYKICRDYRCMEAITVDDVLMAVEKLYNSAPKL